ncbi:hypothetical protein J6590_073720 [Homalodisca vitripennis]|nr:hypothetical protein J6590_093317 [Homalodisca vitripennis]KAG8309923.1 hypothetical protein J6590_073720 [Homalodisca vitripennis]
MSDPCGSSNIRGLLTDPNISDFPESDYEAGLLGSGDDYMPDSFDLWTSERDVVVRDVPDHIFLVVFIHLDQYGSMYIFLHQKWILLLNFMHKILVYKIFSQETAHL